MHFVHSHILERNPKIKITIHFEYQDTSLKWLPNDSITYFFLTHASFFLPRKRTRTICKLSDIHPGVHLFVVQIYTYPIKRLSRHELLTVIYHRQYDFVLHNDNLIHDHIIKFSSKLQDVKHLSKPV